MLHTIHRLFASDRAPNNSDLNAFMCKNVELGNLGLIWGFG